MKKFLFCIYLATNYNKYDKDLYINSLKCLFRYKNLFKKFDICLIDNTTNELDEELKYMLKNYFEINILLEKRDLDNELDKWFYSIDNMKTYEYVVHFDINCLLFEYDFLNSFLKQPRNLFKIFNDYFYEKVFCIRTDIFINFFKNRNKNTNFGTDLHNHFIKNNIPYNTENYLHIMDDNTYL